MVTASRKYMDIKYLVQSNIKMFAHSGHRGADVDTE